VRQVNIFRRQAFVGGAFTPPHQQMPPDLFTLPDFIAQRLDSIQRVKN